MNMKRFLSIFFVLPLVFVSCDLTMDEVSQDVNKPTQVHPKTILTQLCITTFGIEYYGVQPYRLAWQWDQRGGGGHFNFQRRNFISEYRRVTWCYDMIREAERLNDPRYIHLAAYFRASWIFDTTRLFGDVPYTEAAQGRFDDPNFSPKYDPQEEIVAGLLRELAAANEALGDYDNTKIDGDVIFGGDIRKWRQLINLYRLRILINCSMKQTIAGERVGELFAGIVGDPEGNPIMGALSDSAIRDEKGNMENYKYYNDNNFVSSYRISKFVVDWMPGARGHAPAETGRNDDQAGRQECRSHGPCELQGRHSQSRRYGRQQQYRHGKRVAVALEVEMVSGAGRSFGHEHRLSRAGIHPRRSRPAGLDRGRSGDPII